MDFPVFKSKKIVVDTETSGLDVHFGHRICGIAVGDYIDPDVKAYLPVRHQSGNLPLDEVMNWMRALAADPDNVWIGHNLKFDLGMFRADGVEFKGKLVDTMVAAHVLDGDRFSYSLDTLTKVCVPGFEHREYANLKKWLTENQPQYDFDEGKTPLNYSLVPVEILAPYALEDIEATRLLCLKLNESYSELSKQPEFSRNDNFGKASGTLKSLALHEQKLTRVLFDMEWKGITVDVKKAFALKEKAYHEIELYKTQMAELAGFSFNPAAYTEMSKALESCGGKVLFWMKPEEERGKQKTQQYTDVKDNSTGRPCFNAAAVLEYLARFERDSKPWKFMNCYREVLLRERIAHNYLYTYIKRSDYRNRIHGAFNQTTVVTGRLSSSAPNLQNVAKTKGTTDQKAVEKLLGVKQEDALNRQVRGLFIASKPSRVLVSCDMSQAEYRAAVWLSQDEDMIAKWNANPALDYHQDTMDITGLDRDCCKTINFLILYGGGPKGLAATLTQMGKPTTVDQAKQMINTVFAARPALRRLLSDTTHFAEVNRYVVNPMGRVCNVAQGFAYKGLNYKVQGFVGDIMRCKLVDLDALIKREKLPVDMLLTVHDEVVFELEAKDAMELAPRLAAEMCRIPHLGVPMLSDIEVGSSWGTMVAFDEWKKENVA